LQSFNVSGQDTTPQGLFFKPDGAKMYVVGSTNNTIYQYSTVTPAAPSWTDPDLANASYDSVSFSVAGQEAISGGLAFKPDGTKMYVVGRSGDDVNEYDLSSAWDITTASYLQNFSVSAQETSPEGLFFKPDGTKMYIVGQSGDNVYEYNLSSAWDISTASYVQNFSVSTQEASPQGLFFKTDGTKMYVVGVSTDSVYEYSLSSAWDISTASYVQNFSVASQEASPEDLFFNPDGTKMYVIGRGGDDVNEYDLSSAWDISTASYTLSFSVASQETQPKGLFFKPDGSKMFIVGYGTDTIYQYSTD
jgi:DNA-binding beta-propeller fold protein YncE